MKFYKEWGLFMQKRKNRHYTIQVICASIIGIIIGGWYVLFQREFTPVLKEPIVIEYGQEEITKEDILEEVKENEPIKLVEIPEVPKDELGEHEITLTLQKGMRQQETIVPIEVKDTQPPIVNVVQPKITIPIDDDSAKVEDNIVEIKDPVDGKIENIQRGSLAECNMFLRNRMMKTNCVYIGTDFDVHVAGDYEVKIVSYDNSGNLTVRSYTVHVQSVSDKLARNMFMNNDIQLQKEEAIYSTNLNQNYIPSSYFFEQSTYSTREDAEAALRLAETNHQSFSIQTIQGILDNSGKAQTFYVLAKENIDEEQTDTSIPTDNDVSSNQTDETQPKEKTEQPVF